MHGGQQSTGVVNVHLNTCTAGLFLYNPSTSGPDHGLASTPDINNTSSNVDPSVLLRCELRPAVSLSPSLSFLSICLLSFLSRLFLFYPPPSVKMKDHLLILRCFEGRFHKPPDPGDIGLDWHPFNGIQDWRSETETLQCFIFHQLSGMPAHEQGHSFQENFNRQLIFSISYFYNELYPAFFWKVCPNCVEFPCV